MADLKIIDFANSKISSEKLDFNYDGELTFDSPKAVAYVINWQRSKKRLGAAKIKEMSEISGTTAKPYKQKGTGHARQGSKRSVQFRGGRTCFGPKPRSFDYKLPKKIVKNALKDAIKFKAKENKIALFLNAKADLKTSAVNKILKSNTINKALFLYNAEDDSVNIIKSVRNLKNVKALDFKGLNVYDILNYDFLVCDKKLFETIKKEVKL